MCDILGKKSTCDEIQAYKKSVTGFKPTTKAYEPASLLRYMI